MSNFSDCQKDNVGPDGGGTKENITTTTGMGISN